jgi:hypothetical protein
MELDVPYKILGCVDISAFTKYADPSHPTWPKQENDLRSNKFKTHEHTRSILFSWTEHSTFFTEVAPTRYALWYQNEKAIKDICSLASPEMPLNFMIAELKPKSEIHRHQDTHKIFSWARRVHVPLYIPDGVTFTIDDQPVPMCPGVMIEIANTRWHHVVNDSDESRYHIIMDFAP